MMFWDASALVPLHIDGPRSATVWKITEEDGDLVVWWGSSVECCSAFARLRREGIITHHEEDRIRGILIRLCETWTEILPSVDLRNAAEALLLRHPLRAGDSLQLAAARIWTNQKPRGNYFVCLDRRLGAAARQEGFTVIPG